MDDVLQTAALDVPEALSVLESLKLGVVPDVFLDSLSVGLDSLLKTVERDLEGTTRAKPGGAFRVFLGGYGFGKSHLLDRTQDLAMKRGFLVARTAFGSQDSSPDRPLSLYRSLMTELRFPAGPQGGLDRLLEEAGESPEVFLRWTGREAPNRPVTQSTGRRHVWLSTAILGRRLLADAGLCVAHERLLAWLGGQPQAIPSLQNSLRRAARSAGLVRRRGSVDPIEVRSMPRWRSVPQIPCYLLGGIGCLAKDLGYAGLVLLLDEGEHFQWLTSRNLAHAANLAAGLQAVALPARVSDDMPRGGRPAHQDVPYRYRAVQHVACFVALAPQSDPGPALAALAAVPRESTTVLPPLTARHLTTLANRVLDLAGMAGVNGAPTEACRMYLTRHIQAECRAGRPLPPRRVVRLAALLPDLLAAGPVPDDPIAAWMGR